MTLRLTLLCVLCAFVVQADPIRVLIVDGRNNHNWKVTTDSLQATLKATGRFMVDVATAPDSLTPTGPRAPRSQDAAVQERFKAAANKFKELVKPASDKGRSEWSAWKPDFAAYDCVVLNYNGPTWPEETQKSFVDYVRNGGGVLLIHAANNAFSNWDEYNDIIGMGWRKAGYGKVLKVEDKSGKTYVDETAGNSAHGSKHAFQITVRQPNHPIMRGLPTKWMHGRDELYHNMRGPAENLTVLSSAYSDPKQRGTGLHEPMSWEVTYGKGRSMVTSMGHFWRGDRTWDSLYCVGFQTIVARSCEYLATGKVTIPVPDSFPPESEVRIQPPNEVNWRQPANRVVSRPQATAVEKKKANPYCRLTPEEELTTFKLAPGYAAELVAAEPQVQEPVLTVWDGNGAMYVAEMRSYMQDENGTGTKEHRNGRVKRLEDTDGDGRMDRATTFVDNLNLPRMILPLDDWIAIRETDTMDVFAYRDTDGDGVADEKKPLFKYGPRSRNGPNTSVEHQDSGLLWNVDNWIYLSYNMERYRYTDGTWRPEQQPGHWTQWGLTHDDVGRLYWIHNSGPLTAVQLHPKYWNTVNRLKKAGINGLPVNLGDPYTPDFMKAKSLCLLNDRGGPAPAVRGFTSACGQTVFRGDKLPIEDRGRYFFVDPTIHVLRRSNIERQAGKIMLTKAESGDEEFLLSSDINSRFVNTATGPDGTLYVTDMYRGIIQDAPWMNPNARKFIRESGLTENKQMGRIWRIRHRDFEPDQRRPRMLEESTAELVRHFHHENGWWRDTAQRLIILRPDRETIIPLLESTFRYTQNRLARLHALWTLEGIGAINDDLIATALAETREPILRTAGIQIAEADVKRHLPKLIALANDRDPRVAEQLIYTLGTIDNPQAEAAIQTAARRHFLDRSVMHATTVSLWAKKHLELPKAIGDGTAFKKLDEDILPMVASDWRAAIANWDRGLKFPKDFDNNLKRQIMNGEKQYYQYCVTCHASDGKGMKVPGTEQALAPTLAGSKRVTGSPEQLVPIFINGLMGPIEGKNYAAAFMAPAKSLGITRDDRLAEILSFIRYAWGNNATPITNDDVKRIRRKYEKREAPWTEAELKKLGKSASQ